MIQSFARVEARVPIVVPPILRAIAPVEVDR